MPTGDPEQNTEGRRSVDQQQVVARMYGASADDVVSVWRYVSSYIEKQMLKGRGVTVGGLGTFTFAESVSDGATRTAAAKKPRPIFLLAEKFAQLHQLDYAKRYVEGKVPVADLNYAAVASESPFSRDFVDRIVRHVVGEMSRALAGGRNVDLRLEGVGRLTARDKKVKMKFLKDFLAELDPSGRLAAELKDRPDTADSVISRATAARPPTANTLALPSFAADASLAKGAAMATIKEEDDGQQPVKDIPSGPTHADSSDNRPSVECSDSHGDSRERGRNPPAGDGAENLSGAMKRGGDGGVEPAEPRALRVGSSRKARGDPAARTPAPLSTAGIVNFDELMLADDAKGAPAAPAVEAPPHRAADVDSNSAVDERPYASRAGGDRSAR